MQKEITHTWYFKQSPELVWEYLTKPELMEQWMMKTDFQPVVGQKFHLYSPWKNDVADCEVLEVKPFTRLSYIWMAHSADYTRNFKSVVVWTLTPIDKGTELQLVHNGFTMLEDIMGFNSGWNLLVTQLVDLLK
jgi:uncharacterized protein YndB with AHSA1/START domain